MSNEKQNHSWIYLLVGFAIGIIWHLVRFVFKTIWLLFDRTIMNLFRRLRYKKRIKIIAALVQQHSDALLQKKRQTMHLDEYGTIVEDDWAKSINYFIKKVIAPALKIEPTPLVLSLYRPIISQMLHDRADVRPLPYSPLDFEKQICDKLKSMGFNARTTKASGDQGVDVLADRNGLSFAIQCKMYSKPVGNKAVQEVSAGRDFYGRNFGVVVSNADFTKSARQLASANGIILLNDNRLEKLLEYTDK